MRQRKIKRKNKKEGEKMLHTKGICYHVDKEEEKLMRRGRRPADKK
jgi:hypothetical protein